MGAIIGNETFGFLNYISDCAQNHNKNEFEAIVRNTF